MLIYNVQIIKRLVQLLRDYLFDIDDFVKKSNISYLQNFIQIYGLIKLNHLEFFYQLGLDLLSQIIFNFESQRLNIVVRKCLKNLL